MLKGLENYRVVVFLHFYSNEVKILIVEDDRSLCRSINDYLKMEGHICEVALTFYGPINNATVNKYDCIILDIGLPDGNGLDLIREMKSNKLSGGILILSAKSSLDDKLTGLKTGADDYLTKAFPFAELQCPYQFNMPGGTIFSG